MNSDDLKNEKTDPEAPSLEGLNFSGEEQIIDDGIFRISLPSELIPQESEEGLMLRVEGLPFEVRWITGVFPIEELEVLEHLVDSLEEGMRLFMPEFPSEEVLGIIPLSNGFHLASHAWIEKDKSLSRCVLGDMFDDGTLIIASMEVEAPADWEGDFRFSLFRHMLRSRVRFAQCSLDEPPTSYSPDYLYVPKIAVQFPEELGTMRYEYFTDYEAVVEGRGIGLRFFDPEERKADIFVYDCGDDLIEPGPETEQVRDEMDAAMEEIEIFYHPVSPTILDETVTTCGRDDFAFLDRRLLLPDFEGTAGVVTAILLTAFKGAFIKIRFTPLAGECQIHHPVLDSFLSDLGDVIGT